MKDEEYAVSFEYGQISEKLDDKIQARGNATFRDRSCKLLQNAIPRNDYAIESINGIEFKSLLPNEESKSFPFTYQGVEYIAYIFQEKIITIEVNGNKIYQDGIPPNIKVNVSSITGAEFLNEGGKSYFTFTSSNGVYLCEILVNLEGDKMFSSIIIPQSLTGQQIQGVVANIYEFWEEVSFPYSNVYGENGIYVEIISGNLKIGETIKFLANLGDKEKEYSLKVEKIVKGIKIIPQENRNPTGAFMIYPSDKKPTRIPFPQYDLVNDNNFINLITLYKVKSLPYRPWLNDNRKQSNFIRYKYTLGNFVSNPITEKTYGYFAPSVNITKISNLSENQKPKSIIPFASQTINGRLAIGIANEIKLSKTGDITNFDFKPQETPTEVDAFNVKIVDIDSILWIAEWGTFDTGKSIAIGTKDRVITFADISSIFTRSRGAEFNIPCSNIKPIPITIQNYPSIAVVESKRTRITGLIITRDRIQEIEYTQGVSFFDNDPIQKIERIRFDRDNLLFILTDSGKLYGCLTGGSLPAWFTIQTTYKVEDITTADSKLYLTSNLENSSNLKLTGFIDFNEQAERIQAEYFVKNNLINLTDDIVFSLDKPVLLSGASKSFDTPTALFSEFLVGLNIPIEFLTYLTEKFIIILAIFDEMSIPRLIEGYQIKGIPLTFEILENFYKKYATNFEELFNLTASQEEKVILYYFGRFLENKNIGLLELFFIWFFYNYNIQNFKKYLIEINLVSDVNTITQIVDSLNQILNINISSLSITSSEIAQQLMKPFVSKIILHNREIIQKDINTKIQRTKRCVKKLNLNVAKSNRFAISYIQTNNNGKNVFIRETLKVDRINDNLDPERVEELVVDNIGSMMAESVNIQITTFENSIVPMNIKSISYITQYGSSLK